MFKRWCEWGTRFPIWRLEMQFLQQKYMKSVTLFDQNITRLTFHNGRRKTRKVILEC